MRWEKLEMTCGCESRLVKAVAGRPVPSLAGVAATRGPKRRQGSHGVRVVSLETLKIAEAELIPYSEGRVCAVDTRDGDAPPGSRTVPRAKGRLRNPGDPVGSVGLVVDGGAERGKTRALLRAETGSRTGS